MAAGFDARTPLRVSLLPVLVRRGDQAGQMPPDRSHDLVGTHVELSVPDIERVRRARHRVVAEA
jgi:hypothetical protein